MQNEFVEVLDTGRKYNKPKDMQDDLIEALETERAKESRRERRKRTPGFNRLG